ncbi:hypothetical protein C0991_005744 [Blastosporella zonata]|nr:hypothetical protein C0991_005744 [Blastosporella zonata]
MSAGITSAGAQAVKSFRIKQLVGLKTHVIHNGPLPPPTAEKPTRAPHRLPNPFIPHKNPLTGRWAPATISLRRQAELVKKAKASDTLHLLPPGPKNPRPVELTLKAATKLAQEKFGGSPGKSIPSIVSKEKLRTGLEKTWMNPVEWIGEFQAKEVPGAELGTRLYAAKKRMFKGHRWERLKKARKTKKKILMRDMARRIRNYKAKALCEGIQQRPTEPRGDVDGQWVHDKAPTGPRADLGRSKAAAIPAATPNSKLLVSNLHYEITPKDLTFVNHLSGYGQPRASPEKATHDSIAYSHSVFASPLKYDRSGRSSGTAIISFENATEATRAKKQFDGILAKGNVLFLSEPRTCALYHGTPTDMHLFYLYRTTHVDRLRHDAAPPTEARRQCPDVAHQQNTEAPVARPAQPRRLQHQDTLWPVCHPSSPPSALPIDPILPSPHSRGGVGPIRSRPVRGSRGGATAAPRAPRAPKKPKTAEELDQELDAFMGDSESATPAPVAEKPAETEAQPQDVEMV